MIPFACTLGSQPQRPELGTLVAGSRPEFVVVTFAGPGAESDIDKKTTEILSDFYAKNPDLKALNDLAPQLVAPPTWPGTRGSEIPQVTEDAVQSVVGGQDPQAALAELQTKATDLTK